jgi:hypothetical protein
MCPGYFDYVEVTMFILTLYFLERIFMFVKKIVFFLLVVMVISSNQLDAMGPWSKLLQKFFVSAGSAAALSGLGTTYDHQYSEKLDFVDVSTPSNSIVIQECGDFDRSECEGAVTKIQLENDMGLKGPVFLTQKLMGKNYPAIIHAVLFTHFLVLLPTLRNKLANLVMHISHNEVEQQERNNICLVHGTGQAAPMLLRTIFHEVFSNQPVKNFVKLRDDSTVQQLDYYDDVDDYYDEQFDLAPKIEEVINIGSRFVKYRNTKTLFDLGVARNHLLSANFGFFGQSNWIIHERRSSSAEFITRPCSWGYQGIDFLFYLAESLAKNPGVFFMVVQDIVKNPEMVYQAHLLFDKHSKGLDDYSIFEDIFKDHGAQKLYSRYEEELSQMRTVVNAGLVQLFIPRELAARWCYVSKPLGIRVPEYNCGSVPDEALAYNQARVLLHPELCPENGVSMRFYLLGEQEKINAVLARMYEIAQEVKDSRE